MIEPSLYINKSQKKKYLFQTKDTSFVWKRKEILRKL